MMRGKGACRVGLGGLHPRTFVCANFAVLLVTYARADDAVVAVSGARQALGSAEVVLAIAGYTLALNLVFTAPKGPALDCGTQNSAAGMRA